MPLDKAQIQDLAQKILSRPLSDEQKVLMLTWLKEEKPLVFIEAELRCDTLFLGFEPDPSVPLSNLITGTVLCTPRENFPDEQQAIKYVEILRRLKAATQNGIHALARLKTPWADDVGEIVWYNFFSDRVSLRFPEFGGYKVVDRRDLFYGLAKT